MIRKKMKEKLLDLLLNITIIFLNMMCIVCIFYLWLFLVFNKLESDKAYMITKSSFFFSDENNKKKHILLKRYRLEFLIFDNERKCEIIPKTKLISEVKCETKKT